MKDKVRRGGRNQAKNDVGGGTEAATVKRDDDTSFPVKIQGAGVEQFELQVHGFWLVQDAVVNLLSRDEVCPRSNFTLSLAGASLDPLAHMQSIKGLKPGAIVRLVEEPYTARSARHHLARVLELLRASGPRDALRDGRSPSILETLTHTQTQEPNGKSLKRSLSNTKTEAASQDGTPPDYLLPGSSDRPLMALLPNSSQAEVPSFVKDLSLSCWNPPPGHRKLQGDFLYITVVTMEGRRSDITSSPKGFFLNRSTEEVFDPRPVQSTPVYHCFTDLLCHISPAFKQTFASLRNRHQQLPVEMTPTPYHTLCWLGPPCASRTHRNTFNGLVVDEQLANQGTDWNEELQAARDLPQSTLEERLQRERALLQVNSAFVKTVVQAVEPVMEGFVDPVNGNPDDPAFLWGGVFMSQGAANPEFGGERGRRAAQRLELRGVQAYSDIEHLQGLHTLPTAIVDYRGVRLSAQGLAPGLGGSESDQENSPASRGLLYGVNAGPPAESPHRRRLLELLAHSAKALSLQKHVVVAPSGHQVPLFTSVDSQGLLGADGRFYLLDVFRTFPADANFCPEIETVSEAQENCEEDNSVCVKEGWPENYNSSSGLPRRFTHSLCRLRPELMKAFIQHKHAQFSQCVRDKLNEEGGFEECATASDSRAREAVRLACKEVGSVSNIIFEMGFSPSTFSPGVVIPSAQSTQNQLQERLLKEAAAFIVTHQIPAFLEFCLQSDEAPMDGASLKRVLHHRGVNLRYLGHVITAIKTSEQKERLRHIMRLVVGEVLMRSTRRVFNSFLQGVDIPSLAAAISHFLCCLLAPQHATPPTADDSKKKSRRRGRGPGAAESTPWSMLTGSELWNLVCQDAVETYNISDDLGSGVTQLVELHGFQKISLLREFCLKTGVQLRLRDYIFDSQSKAPVSPDDILNVFPVVKHLNMPTADASRALEAAQTSIQKGLLDQAHEHLKEAGYLFSRVCDDLHPEASYCHTLMAKVAFLQGKLAEARSVQLKAVVISERVLGFDHPNTIQQYTFLAVYLHAGGETALAQKCLLRARLLLLTVHGEDHPYIATVDSCLGLMMTGAQAAQFLKNALKINTSFFGPSNLYTALSQHLLAQWMCSQGDYRSAMSHEKEALTAFTLMFGEDHAQTRCSTEFLSTITKQAVKVERSLRQAATESSEHPVECITPSSDTIQEQMGLVTGIKRIAYSNKFLEFKQKHKEIKAAVAKELLSKLSQEPLIPDSLEEAGKSENKETGSWHGAENGGSLAVSQAENQPEEETGETSTSVLANGHESDAEGKTQVDGPSAESTAVKSEANNPKDLGGAVSKPSLNKGTWADVVSKSPVANGTENKHAAVNGVSVNGAAEE
ncbi:clustered mitochondria protein homolog [Synchiropus picturatus]